MKNNVLIKASKIKPSKRQLNWQQTEFYGFIHFGMNTMTGREWGTGDESPDIFNPSQVNTDSWIETLKNAGMKGAILTCKHHDGFCLWPTNTTSHSVKNSPWQNGTGDLVKDFSESCRKFGLKFGIYLSPWDMNADQYGMGQQYDDFYIEQLTELLTNYGDVFEVWLDGANGEGPNGKKQEYDWSRYYQKIRELQPNAVIAVCGPDVRWIGNEAGYTRSNEWSVVPEYLREAELTSSFSQQEEGEEFREKLNSTTSDLGSNEILKEYNGELVWYPAEVDISIRPGWFYHRKEDNKVKSVTELFDIYMRSVGGNSCLLLNIPPDSRGMIAKKDKEVLEKLGEKILSLDKENLLKNAKITLSSQDSYDAVERLIISKGISPTWVPDSQDKTPTLNAHWDEKKIVSSIILQEAIQEGQLIENVRISFYKNNKNIKTIETGVIGYKRIINLNEIETDHIKIEISNFRALPKLSSISII